MRRTASPPLEARRSAGVATARVASMRVIIRFIGLAAFVLAAIASHAAVAAGVLRIGMTASDIPLSTGQADNGAEGMRFMGYTVYDGLVNWDLSSADKPSDLVPGLAVSWSVDEADKTKWTFKLRQGVTFHDGSAFTAEAVVRNLDKLLNDKSPQYDPRQSAQGRSRIPGVASYRAVDPTTLEITTKGVDATLAYQLAWIMISSPGQWEKVGKSWDAFAKTPAGTGPWKLTGFVPRERAEMVRNPDYWDKARVPKLDRLVLIPLPEPNARVAALRAGQVDWIEAPAPDAVASLKSAGFKIVTNAYPHNWTWHLSRVEGSPWNDIRVRKAANLAVDRDGMKELLSGLMIPAEGFLPPGHQWFGKPTFTLKYDPTEAKKLLREAGYGPDKPLTLKALISPSGSGQMQPLPMNEFIQQNLAEVGIKLDFEVVEWNQLINIWRAGAADPSAKGGQSLNFTYFIQDPFTGFIRHVLCNLKATTGTNWGHYCDPEMDKLLDEVRNAFDPKEQTAVLQKVHEKFVNEALFLMVTHDVNARALSPKVKNFVQAKNWFQDFSPIAMGN